MITIFGECERVLRYFFEFRNFELQISERYITEKLDSDISSKRYMFDTSQVWSNIFSNFFDQRGNFQNYKLSNILWSLALT
jgi:hypothetical protein